uniref:Uncharacterized protein n=1 Tax=Setaria viridis TaxID=4556 RepID=A0A4U6VF76_SETVI|nr:hypothetical protein SEVIR_3G298366v2 [Setaria viridis]
MAIVCAAGAGSGSMQLVQRKIFYQIMGHWMPLSFVIKVTGNGVGGSFYDLGTSSQFEGVGRTRSLSQFTLYRCPHPNGS